MHVLLGPTAAPPSPTVVPLHLTFKLSSPSCRFDVLGTSTPTNQYFLDDAGVLSKTTRADLNKRLTLLEVGMLLLYLVQYTHEH